MPNLISAASDCELKGISKFVFQSLPQIQHLTFNGDIGGFINYAVDNNMNLRQVLVLNVNQK